MHRGLLVAALLLIAPRAAAQVNFYGTIGIYDDPAHTQPFGTMVPLVSKTIYVGVHLNAEPDGLTGLEFSIAGLDAVILFGVDIQPPSTFVLGDIHAPVDTTTGSGGINISWSTCIPDIDVSIALSLVSAVPPSDHTFQILHRFPSALLPPHVFASPCHGPCFCPMPLEGRGYTLNPTDATEARTWSVVKNLYRSP